MMLSKKQLSRDLTGFREPFGGQTRRKQVAKSRLQPYAENLSGLTAPLFKELL
jgi:hypothetical protein